MIEGGGHVIPPAERLGERQASLEGRRRPTRRQRLIKPPGRLVEAAEQSFAEADGQRGAR